MILLEEEQDQLLAIAFSRPQNPDDMLCHVYESINGPELNSDKIADALIRKNLISSKRFWLQSHTKWLIYEYIRDVSPADPCGEGLLDGSWDPTYKQLINALALIPHGEEAKKLS
ncbi:hypothetical protein IAQ61_001402 [Plenodomus lingam]|nr:hypothetical protein IAQ61_001402 [Plenodomus lingam]